MTELVYSKANNGSAMSENARANGMGLTFCANSNDNIIMDTALAVSFLLLFLFFLGINLFSVITSITLIIMSLLNVIIKFLNREDKNYLHIKV